MVSPPTSNTPTMSSTHHEDYVQDRQTETEEDVLCLRPEEMRILRGWLSPYDRHRPRAVQRAYGVHAGTDRAVGKGERWRVTLPYSSITARHGNCFRIGSTRRVDNITSGYMRTDLVERRIYGTAVDNIS